MSERARILITGFMAAGKTTVAAALARRLDCRMLDLDEFIVERAGRSIQTIIDEDGEAQFRQMESHALREALENSTARVIALGGGTWMSVGNRTLIAEHNALTIWLDAPFELCWQRIRRSRNDKRPLARDRKRARALYDERHPLYKLAALHLNVSEHTCADDLAAQIETSLLQRRPEG
jgi:shikimate kinase